MEVVNAVPDQIRKQGENADALHRKLYPDQYPKAGGEQTGKEGDAGAAKPGDEGKKETAAPESQVAKAGEAKVEPAADEWKQKYETLQGKYNAEVPQLHTLNAGLRNQLQEALSKVKELEEKNAAAATAKDPDKESGKENGAAEETDPVLKSVKEEYPDIYEAMKKMVAKTQPAPAKERTTTDASKEVKERSSADARQTMMYFLQRDVPDWKEINNNQEFIQSLQVSDPLNPASTKIQSLNLAFQANDFTTVIGYFRDFKLSKEAAGAGKQSPSGGAEKPGGDSGRELTEEEKALNPPKGNRAPMGPGGDQPTVTPQDLAKFYDEARRGLWGPIIEEKYRKEEARLLAALTKRT